MIKNDFPFVVRTKPGEYKPVADAYETAIDHRIDQMQRDTKRYVDDLNSRTARQVSRAQTIAQIMHDFYIGNITKEEMNERLASYGIK